MELKELKSQMYDIKIKIDQLRESTGFSYYEELSNVNCDITNPNELQLMDEFTLMMEKLSDVYYRLDYLHRPINFEDTLRLNSDGRYETNNERMCYASGQTIEFCSTKEILNQGHCIDAGVWIISRIEHNGSGYYIVGYPDVSLQDLCVRVRSR